MRQPRRKEPQYSLANGASRRIHLSTTAQRCTRRPSAPRIDTQRTSHNNATKHNICWYEPANECTQPSENSRINLAVTLLASGPAVGGVSFTPAAGPHGRACGVRACWPGGREPFPPGALWNYL